MNEMILPSRDKTETRAPAAWGQARYLSVTEVPLNNKSLRVSGLETFSLKVEGQSGVRPRNFHVGSFNICSSPNPPPPPFNPFKPEFTIVILIHYKPRIAVAISTCSGWRWFDVGEKSMKIAMYWQTSFMKIIIIKPLVVGKTSLFSGF